MDYRIIYYVQINLICIAVLLLILFRGIRYNREASVQTKIIRCIVLAACVLCVSDVAAAWVRGADFAGADICVHLANMIYLLSGVIIAFEWIIYVLYETGHMKKRWDRVHVLCAVPLILFMVLLVSNPFTGLLFTVTEDNLYQRGPAVAVHSILCFFYVLVGTAVTVAALRREESRLRRAELKPLLYFAVPAITGGLIQVFCYGITIFQAGVTVAVLLLFETKQKSVIHTDSLTKMNNRRALEEYIEGMTRTSEPKSITFIMMDVNNFKMINDTLGHLAGDEVLREVSGVIKHACGVIRHRIFVCRYGGDEFLLAGTGISDEELSYLTDRIRRETGKLVSESYAEIDMSVSIGVSSGVCRDYEDAIRLISEADSRMYENKHNLR